MHHLFGCWLSCALIWWGNNVKHRFIHIYKRLTVCKRRQACILFLDWADTPAPARHAGRQAGPRRRAATCSDRRVWGINGRATLLDRTMTWHNGSQPCWCSRGLKEGIGGSVGGKDAKFTWRATRQMFRWCAASLPISSSFNMKGNLPILETDKGLEALQTLAPQLFWTW